MSGTSCAWAYFSHSREPFPVLRGLVRLFLIVFPVERDPDRILQYINLDALLPQHRFIARGIGDIADHHTGELAHVDQRGADVAGAQGRKDCRPAEVLTAGVANSRSLPMIIRV